MRAVVQRIYSGCVEVDGEVVGQCGKGLAVFAGAHRMDTVDQARKMADRIWGIRILGDSEGKINLSLRDLHASGESVGVLAISNFTLYGDASKNRRPSFTEAAAFDEGKALFDEFVAELRRLGCPTETGVFGADMKVSLVNDGPVTIILDV